MIPFNDIYSIARERDNEIHQAANPDYGVNMQQREPRRTIAAFLQRLLGISQAPADAAWVQGIEPGR
jgi:hypothetical protein